MYQVSEILKICKIKKHLREEGIHPNDLISEYYGEIYTAWRWFEKQDLVKKYFKEKNVRDINLVIVNSNI